MDEHIHLRECAPVAKSHPLGSGDSHTMFRVLVLIIALAGSVSFAFEKPRSCRELLKGTVFANVRIEPSVSRKNGEVRLNAVLAAGYTEWMRFDASYTRDQMTMSVVTEFPGKGKTAPDKLIGALSLEATEHFFKASES